MNLYIAMEQQINRDELLAIRDELRMLCNRLDRVIIGTADELRQPTVDVNHHQERYVDVARQPVRSSPPSPQRSSEPVSPPSGDIHAVVCEHIRQILDSAREALSNGQVRQRINQRIDSGEIQFTKQLVNYCLHHMREKLHQIDYRELNGAKFWYLLGKNAPSQSTNRHIPGDVVVMERGKETVYRWNGAKLSDQNGNGR